MNLSSDSGKTDVDKTLDREKPSPSKVGITSIAANKLTKQIEFLQATIDLASVGLICFDVKGRVLNSNKRLEELFKVSHLRDKKLNYLIIYNWLQKNISNWQQAFRLFSRPIKTYYTPVVIIFEMNDGRYLRCSSSSLVFNQRIEAIVWSVEDITSLKVNEQVARHKAEHDCLTSLPNRDLYFKLLAEKICVAERYKKNLVVLFIDIDHFKLINDNYGHDVGDQLLTKTSHRIAHSLRRPDILARLSGDEFVAILEEVEGKDDVEQVIRRVFEHFSLALFLEEYTLKVTVSIGVAFFTKGDDPHSLTNKADKAMYSAKRSGRNTFCFYDSSMEL